MNSYRSRILVAAAFVFATCSPHHPASGAEANRSRSAVATADDEQTRKAVIVLDGSGSMWGKIDGTPKIQLAKRAVGDLLESLDPRIRLGLIAYGNTRERDCSDINTLVSVGEVDRERFRDIVGGIIPRGRTPLSDAIEVAAQQLDYTVGAADIILLSDGVETCHRDPCALAKQLAEAGPGLRIHVVAFDLTAEEEQTLSCLSSTTGGVFLPARDAGSLKEAFRIAVKEVVEPPSPLLQPAAVSVADQAGLDAPRFVPAGWTFEVAWSGPDGRNDYITIVPPGSPDTHYDNYTHTSLGDPLELIAAIDPGEYELRYVVPRARTVLARRPITVVESRATLSAPETTLEGASIEVEWVGPADRGDYITIVPASAEPDAYARFQPLRNFKGPVTLQAPGVPGPYEIRYVSGQKGRVLASIPIFVIAPGASLEVPGNLVAGFAFDIDWSGPGQPGDYITIVQPAASKRSHLDSVYIRGLKEPARLRAPREPGAYEVRYALGGAHDIVARVAVDVSGTQSPAATPSNRERD